MSTHSYTYECRQCGTERTLDIPVNSQEDADGVQMVQSLEIHMLCPVCSSARARRTQVALCKDTVDLSDIPIEFRDSDEEQFPQPQWLSASNWVPAQRGLYLCGPSRRCKTRIAYRVAIKYRRLNRSVLLLDSRTFRAEVETRIMSGHLWNWYADIQGGVDIVLLDDLGKFRGDGKRIEEELFHLVKMCTEWRIPMIITSQDSLDTLASHFSPGIGPPIVERLRETCRVVSFWTPGETTMSHAIEDL